jgi:hypothetical protein
MPRLIEIFVQVRIGHEMPAEELDRFHRSPRCIAASQRDFPRTIAAILRGTQLNRSIGGAIDARRNDVLIVKPSLANVYSPE